MSKIGGKWDDEYAVLLDKEEIGFIDYQDDKTACSYNPMEEGPIVISVPFPFVSGKPQSVFVGETIADSISLQNTTGEAVDLWTKIYASNPENSFTLSLMKPPSNLDASASQGFQEYFTMEDRMLQPGDTLTIWVSCKPKDIGLHTTVVQFDIDYYRIERTIFLLAEDKISQSLTSKRPYSRAMRKKRRAMRKKNFVVDAIVAASRPAKAIDRGLRNRLPQYDIPKNIRELLERKQIPDPIVKGLTIENYTSYFKTLLIMEEIKLEEDMRTFDMESVTMRKKGNLLSLVVPGLAEQRPSLVHRDFIFARFTFQDGRDTTSTFQGYIHHVEADEVYLKFADEFHFLHRNRNKYSVHFAYNRINARRLYQAIDAAEALEIEFLFPSESYEKRIIDITTMVPISCFLNEEQMYAIEKILGCKGAPPYVLHGPPGTGKTMTVVEAILQLYTTRKDARILVCAQSNSAADHILEKLLNENIFEIQENEIFRLNATTRPFKDIKPDFIRFCNFDKFIFKCPPLKALARYKIIISTYMSAFLLYAEGVERGHFTHIFLDDAGQASEPESMIPISNLCLMKTVVVLAGDPMQLGPVIYSKEAEDYGVGRSYLERLFECEHYIVGDENYVTKLVRNYRCHPEILDLPSKLFYKGELIPCKDDTSSFLTLVNFLPNREFPVIFYGIQGCDEREGNNPSWFNRIEVSKVVEIIQKLTASGNVKDENIGVITPYRLQVLKLKEVLEKLDMPDIKVGSVEQFQGQERQVIIVSNVRSTVKHNEFDRSHRLGFLSNSRRFNVAITRAISLLVIIGNPHIINKDAYWSKLLWRCADKNSYQGCALPKRQEEYIDEGHVSCRHSTSY